MSTPGKVEHNKPDMVLWNLKNKKCTNHKSHCTTGHKPRVCLHKQAAEVYATHLSDAAIIHIVHISHGSHHDWSPRSSAKKPRREHSKLGIDNDRLLQRQASVINKQTPKSIPLRLCENLQNCNEV